MTQALERRDAARQRAEAALRQSEERYRRIIDTANEGIWVLDQDFRTTFVNPRLAEMLGYSVGEMVGRNLVEFLFTEDVPGYARRVERRSRDAAEQYECRLRRRNGQALWTLVSATALLDKDGRFSGSFAMLADITERRQAEEAVRELSGQLLQLQDEERRRVARELHDHAAQWLAALAMNLTGLEAMTPASNSKARQLLAESSRLLDQCSLEIRTLSCLLHPPLLDELGLAGAIEEFADQFARRSGIQVQVVLPDLGRLPREVEMALFRVVQEALMNVHRHSGSPTACVRLIQERGGVCLEVSDAGHGMKPPEESMNSVVPQRLGVGIAGMRERLRQLGGQLEIESSPQGTTVRARVPIR